MRAYFLAGAAAAALLSISATPAGAQTIGVQVIASGHQTNTCLDIKAGSNEALLWTCHGGENQRFAFASGSYGQIRVNSRCLSTSGGAGTPIVAAGCANTPAQRWVNTKEGFLRNEQNLCADVERGGGAGSRVIAWDCNKGMFGGLFGPPSNQRWGFARLVPQSLLSSLPKTSSGKTDLSTLGVMDAGGRVVAPGGGNVVAPGGGNVIAPGGANVVAPGGANVIAPGGGNIIVPVSGLVAG